MSIVFPCCQDGNMCGNLMDSDCQSPGKWSGSEATNLTVEHGQWGSRWKVSGSHGMSPSYCRHIMWCFPFQKTSCEQQSEIIQFDVYHIFYEIEQIKQRKMPNFRRFTWPPRLVIEETIWKAVPEHYRRLDRCLKRIGVEGLPLDASILKVSSWMGGAVPALPQDATGHMIFGALAWLNMKGCSGHDEAEKTCWSDLGVRKNRAPNHP